MSAKRSAEIIEDSEDGNLKRNKSIVKNAKHPLRRDLSAGMNPVTLLTGYYGARGERIRHVVHEGALRLPQDALDICAPASLSGKKFALPELDSVARPTVDSRRKSVLVTDLTVEMVDGEPDGKQILKTVANNRVIHLEEDPMRIRGGGEEGDDTADADAKDVFDPPKATGSFSDAAPSVFNAPMSVPVVNTASEKAATIPSTEAAVAETASQIPAQATVASDLNEQQPSVQAEVVPDATIVSNSTTPQALLSGTPPITGTSETVPAPTLQVVGLPKQPNPAWEQHMPGPNDEMTIDPSTTSPKPEWFNLNRVSSLERSLLPEWFDGSAPHRTEQSFLQTRSKLMDMSEKLGTRYLTATMARRSVPGDAGSLMRLHAFLCSYNLINEHSLNDSAPLPVSMQEPSEVKKGWDEPLNGKLLEAIVKESRENHSGPINWENISKLVGQGKKPAECEQQFLSMHIPEETVDVSLERSITPDATTMKERSLDTDLDTATLSKILQQLVEKTDSNVLHSVTTAALISTRNNLSRTQQAVAVGLAVSHAEKTAEEQEARVGAILSQVVELRMQKLENRLALLDDVEGMLEAERAALELERRDLYTARCRHWFQGP
ncbi:SWI/SNF related-matrix-associated actin-dependent regulator of chromatin subfamily C [Fistulifera solaris]|uniref:SWI/SNF related-matrix-associated actin-dependent regulator of chromatin subfamily C n=1 Tax=Fistulifera solaris TaxID=1519565 RepID=A0A1Z5J8U4_FISSO|nr:SWI/SNF related-matrix-associated actin-dependent regulator of chromatin subfamily C [Fistulifera solaris]|eukprot:GAX10410.1 SWI/SNF related-matrix-associated actin-dependent regulator of chromatin subfamily C [Fistulifera solaris]